MANVYKALSALLSYPTEELQQSAAALWKVVDQEPRLPPALKRRLAILAEEIATFDMFDLQERYVLLFDRTRSLSLHLFEHVHGESRDRGQAMVDLKQLYERNGLTISATELPDHLPLFLEFLSTRPAAEAREILGQTTHILDALAERLRRRGSPYEWMFLALIALAGAEPKLEDRSALIEQPDCDPDDLQALDAAWEDEPVSFGPGAMSSCKDGLIARIRAARRPVQQPEA